MKKNPVGAPKGQKQISGQATQAAKRKIDVNIRRIFEEEATQSDALRNAIRYMFENDPVVAVHAYLKLLATNTAASPVRSVTNVFAEQIDARRIVQHVEELARLSPSAGHETVVSDQLVLSADDGSGTH